MADNDATPMDASDITASSTPTTAEPLKGATLDTGGESEGGTSSSDTTLPKPANVKQAVTQSAGAYRQQATDKVRTFAEDGKARATGALEQLAQLLTDAAGQVDEKLGAQYGGYARNAADSVSGFADQVKAKDMDELVENARELVRKSPGIAIGAAAAVGFVVARLVQSGVDAGTEV